MVGGYKGWSDGVHELAQHLAMCTRRGSLELHKCCSEYKILSNFSSILCKKIENIPKLKNATNLKPPQILKCHKFQTAEMCSFIPTISFLFPTFVLLFPSEQFPNFSLVFKYLKS